MVPELLVYTSVRIWRCMLKLTDEHLLTHKLPRRCNGNVKGQATALLYELHLGIAEATLNACRSVVEFMLDKEAVLTEFIFENWHLPSWILRAPELSHMARQNLHPRTLNMFLHSCLGSGPGIRKIKQIINKTKSIRASSFVLPSPR